MTKPTTRFPHPFTRVRGLLLLAALLVLAATPLAAAQAIVSRAASQTAYVGEPLRVVVQVQDVEGFDGPVVPEVDGLVISRLPGEQTSSRIEFINGRSTQSKTVGISYEVTPSRTGAFTIPPFSVTVGGQTLSSAPIPIKVEVSETGDLLWVAVSSAPRTMFVGERGRLELEIGVKRYRDEKLGITLDDGSTRWMEVGGLVAGLPAGRELVYVRTPEISERIGVISAAGLSRVRKTFSR